MRRVFTTGAWLTGPIFDKELRVSSRRRRNYLLRIAYITLLAIFLSMVWAEQVGRFDDDYSAVARMSEVGLTMTSFIVWFQFIACQLLAVIMLSTAISGEVYHRTLGVLMTTPITSLQIVLGKLFSKLWQLILLLAISLPLLAIIRVFGGIPWRFLIQALAITFCATLFVGALSLFYSIYLRRSYVVIIVAIITVVALFLFLPLFIALLAQDAFRGRQFEQFFSLFNPFFALGIAQEHALAPGRGFTLRRPLWLEHCGVMLMASGVLLGWSVARVRTAALGQIAGGAAAAEPPPRPTQAQSAPREPSRPLKRVQGSPILWKECHTPLLGRYRTLVTAMTALLLIPLLMTYLYLAVEEELNEAAVHIGFTLVYLGLGMLLTIVIPATSVTVEKESQAWPILLGTTVGDRAILMGKAWGALRRCIWAWAPLITHILVFTLLYRVIHPVAALGILLVIASCLGFHIGSGLYFSALSKRTTTAVVLNFVLPALVWIMLPILIALSLQAAHLSVALAEAYTEVLPFVQIIALLLENVPIPISAEYNGPHLKMHGFAILAFLMVTTAMYITIGALFAWRAECRFRRDVFG